MSVQLGLVILYKRAYSWSVSTRFSHQNDLLNRVYLTLSGLKGLFCSGFNQVLTFALIKGHGLWNWPQFYTFKRKPLNAIWYGWVIEVNYLSGKNAYFTIPKTSRWCQISAISHPWRNMKHRQWKHPSYLTLLKKASLKIKRLFIKKPNN